MKLAFRDTLQKGCTGQSPLTNCRLDYLKVTILILNKFQVKTAKINNQDKIGIKHLKWTLDCRNKDDAASSYGLCINIPWETLDDGHKDDCLMVTRILIMPPVMVSCGHIKHLRSVGYRVTQQCSSNGKIFGLLKSTGPQGSTKKSSTYFPLSFIILGIFPFCCNATFAAMQQ